MEADNEVSGTGNSYTTEFRQYDPRLGHWKSLDPLIAQFPWQSPYCAFDNNPIFYTDPFGLAAEGGDDKKNPNKVTSETNTGKGTESSPHQIDEIKVTPKSKSEAVKKHETNPTFQLGSFSHPILESGRISDAGWLDPIFILAEEGLKAIGINEKAANVIVSVVPLFIGSVKNPISGLGAKKGSLNSTKSALNAAKTKLGMKPNETLPKLKNGKYGSPQRGTAQKGYRLDPAHPNAKPGSGEEYPHINYWDYTKGKREKGGVSGAEPIKD
jgi:RHS repeat-associated protein